MINLLLALITVLLTIFSWLKDIRSQDKEKRLYGILSIALIFIAAVLTIIKDRDSATQIQTMNQVINEKNVQIGSLNKIIEKFEPQAQAEESPSNFR